MGYEDEAWLERVTTEQPRRIDDLIKDRSAARARALAKQPHTPPDQLTARAHIAVYLGWLAIITITIIAALTT